MPLAIYIILSEVHRNRLEAMRITTGVSGLKARLSHMIVIICMHYLESPVVKNVNSFFLFIETITGRYLVYRIVKCVSLI